MPRRIHAAGLVAEVISTKALYVAGGDGHDANPLVVKVNVTLRLVEAAPGSSFGGEATFDGDVVRVTVHGVRVNSEASK